MWKRQPATECQPQEEGAQPLHPIQPVLPSYGGVAGVCGGTAVPHG